jgi:autotransporter translocation and assembly factor TamB
MADSPFSKLVPPASGRMSAAELRSALAGTPKSAASTNKFGAKAVYTEEGKFDSGEEYKRYLELKLLLRAGVIQDLRRQVRYKLEAGGIHISVYVADFVYIRDGVEIVEDSKGFKTREYLQKRRLMKETLGIDILETGRASAPPSSRKKRRK